MKKEIVVQVQSELDVVESEIRKLEYPWLDWIAKNVKQSVLWKS
ncbi:hypothetical protein [Bacillus cereus]|nr:hypothetical protein [Bacillus cereus]MDV6367369.1 hypothetical protein [Bacillus cereus]